MATRLYSQCIASQLSRYCTILGFSRTLLAAPHRSSRDPDEKLLAVFYIVYRKGTVTCIACPRRIWVYSLFFSDWRLYSAPVVNWLSRDS
jgi:hypothetical protein